MIRYLVWGLFILVTVGAISFQVRYEDGFFLQYQGWIV
jgi:hypothetical protein